MEDLETKAKKEGLFKRFSRNIIYPIAVGAAALTLAGCPSTGNDGSESKPPAEEPAPTCEIPSFSGSGNTITVDDDSGADYSTIQAALSAASSGDKISIAPGTYNETLDLENKKLELVGSGINATTIDASSESGYAIKRFGDSSHIKNLGLIGTNSGGNSDYGFKISGVDGISLNNIKVEDSYKTGVDLNGVNGGVLKNIESVNTNSGFGINMVDSNNLCLEDIATSGNAWGGVSIQTIGSFYPGGSNNIVFFGSYNSQEDVPFLLEQDPHPTTGEYSNISNVKAPDQFGFVTYGLRTSDNYRQWFYKETESEANSFASAISGSHANVSVNKEEDVWDSYGNLIVP